MNLVSTFEACGPPAVPGHSRHLQGDIASAVPE
jgi:hypothetical protein